MSDRRRELNRWFRALAPATEADLRDELTRLQSEVERLRGRCGDREEWFLRGACATLAMFDPKSTEYNEAVVQHGGYEVLYAVAEEYDRDHLYVAAKWNEGSKYAGDLHIKIYEAEREAQRLRQQAAESESGTITRKAD